MRITDVPRYLGAMYRHLNLSPQALLDHRLPWNQAESYAVIEHGKATADKLHAASVYAAHTNAVNQRSVCQLRLGGNSLCRLFQLPRT